MTEEARTGQEPSQPAPVQPAVANTQPVPQSQGEPTWLPERLKRAEESAVKELLKSTGFTSLEDLKAAKAVVDAQKTEAQRTAERLAALEPKAKEAEDYRARLERYADSVLAGLSEVQRSAVLSLSGGDKARALDAVEALRPTWVQAAPAAPPAVPVASPTAPSSPAPSSATASSKPKTAEWEELKKTNPFAAAQFRFQHLDEIQKETASK